MLDSMRVCVRACVCDMPYYKIQLYLSHSAKVRVEYENS